MLGLDSTPVGAFGHLRTPQLDAGQCPSDLDHKWVLSTGRRLIEALCPSL